MDMCPQKCGALAALHFCLRKLRFLPLIIAVHQCMDPERMTLGAGATVVGEGREF